MYLCWTQGKFFRQPNYIIVFELGFCFLDPCACFVDLASMGANSIVVGAQIGLDVFGPWRFFLGLAQGGGNLDIETRCMQEVVDAGEVRILQQQKRRKWRRGQ